MFRNYFKTAVRTLLRNKGYSFIHIVGLSLGLACVMLIILYVKDETSFDRWHANAGRLYRVARKRVTPDGAPDNSGYTGIFQGPRFAAQVPGIAGYSRFENGYVNIRLGSGFQPQQVRYVDPAFLVLFSFPLSGGNGATALQDPNSVVITEEVAKRQFGSSDVVGKTLFIEENSVFRPRLITAVAKKCPENSSIQFEVLLPMKVAEEAEAKNENWFNFSLSTFVLLKPEAEMREVERQMEIVYEKDAAPSIEMIKKTFGLTSVGISYFLQPLTDVHLGKLVNDNGGLADASTPMYVFIFTAISAFILLIACINFVNLTVARSLKRAKEIGVRKVIGGERRQLIAQFLGESAFLCFAAFVLAIGLAWVLLPVFNRLSNKALSLSYLLDARLVAGYIGLSVVTVLLAGFYPALVLSGFHPVETLYGRARIGGRGYLQQGLVVFQFTLSSFLIVATLAVYQQLNFLTTQDMGYVDKDLVTTHVPYLSRGQFRLFREELLKDAAIGAVAAGDAGSWQTVKTRSGRGVNIHYETIDGGYFPLLKIPLVAGRNFSAESPADSTHSILVNEAFVREAGWRQPVGQLVDFIGSGAETYTVIGVVRDYHFEPMTERIKPQLFTMKPANPFGEVFVRVEPRRLVSALRTIEGVYRQLLPLASWNYSFKDADNRKSYQAESRWRDILLYSSVLTIFISCIGLFGLSVLAAERRTKEIGIRKVLGASVSGVVALLATDFVKLVGIALIISMPLAWVAAARWLENYPYRIALAWTLFGGAAVLVLAIALATVSFQSIRAALGNPASSLRSE